MCWFYVFGRQTFLHELLNPRNTVAQEPVRMLCRG
jgi:hypothetical protein